MNFSGKTALITGGAQGIGASIAGKLLALDANVVVADMNKEIGETFVQGWADQGKQAVFTLCDVTKSEDIQAAAALAEERFGGVDILVNNAGIFPRATLLETDEVLWDRIMNINLKGAFMACKAVVPLMIRRGGGSIVNIGSLHAGKGGEDLFAYAISKGGIVTLTRNLAHALAKHRIRANCVHPGWVASEGERELWRQKGKEEDWLNAQGENIPLGRLQTVGDIAETILFLSSDNASQVTGQSVAVDGGLGFLM
ncbi:SDR family NAD(P)-dependent oxidoreductase [Paenibacillus thalictri]|uniref:SDR family NAD(P)-dependent oxidoreductase n=1 Tax=Paenibacillus thalictri TaxID=2527873 RepID=UPI0013EF2B86|nr:SDR family oxidoreductase [Paenibacillus thalictri]